MMTVQLPPAYGPFSSLFCSTKWLSVSNGSVFVLLYGTHMMMMAAAVVVAVSVVVLVAVPGLTALKAPVAHLGLELVLSRWNTAGLIH